MKRSAMAMLFAAAVLVGGAEAALAHVTVQPPESTPGAFARFVVRVPSERTDASTIKVEVQFPELFLVSFEDRPGWERTVAMKELDPPATIFGEEVSEVVDTVTWEGGEIEPGEFAEFGFTARMPEEEATLAFPAIQTYDSGEVVSWIGPVDSETPAAIVKTHDIGAVEGEGELAVLARLAEGRAASPPSDEGGSGLGVVLGSIGIGLGALSLIVTMVRTRG